MQNTVACLVYPQKFVKYMLVYIVCAHPVPILVAYSNGFLYTSLVNALLMCTSLNYWRRPLLTSPRRYVDIAMCAVAGGLHIAMIPACIPVYVSGGSFYFLSNWFGARGMHMISLCMHCLVHFTIGFGVTLAYCTDPRN